MKFEEAEKLICPYSSNNCIVDKCMFWTTSVNGKKEIHRVIVPYDLYPMEEKKWRNDKKEKGYENIGSKDSGFRDVFVKYEESREGYCRL